VYAERSAPDWACTRVGTGPPPGSCSRSRYALSWDLGTPLRAAQTPFQGSGLHTWRSGTNLGGPDYIFEGLRPTLGVRTVYLGVQCSPMGVRTHC
jgi:hypothetical protein